MKIQIQRFSLHQNAKVMAIVWTVCIIIFLVPFMLLMMLLNPEPVRYPVAQFIPMLLMPLVYLVFTYISSIIALAIYNALVPKIGGIEYIAEVTRTDMPPNTPGQQ